MSLALSHPLSASRLGALSFVLIASSCSLVGYHATEDAPQYVNEDGGDSGQPGEASDASEPGEGAPDASAGRETGSMMMPIVDAQVAHDADTHDAESLDANMPTADAAIDAGVPDAETAIDPPIVFPDDAAVTMTVPDAAIAKDAGSDAGPKPDAGAPPTCGGSSSLGLCWYLGSFGASCQATCAGHGGFDSRSIAHVGTTTQGGSWNDCRQILSSLGFLIPPLRSYRTDAYALGCHQWTNNLTYWLDNPSADFKATSAGPYAKLACGCMK